MEHSGVLWSSLEFLGDRRSSTEFFGLSSFETQDFFYVFLKSSWAPKVSSVSSLDFPVPPLFPVAVLFPIFSNVSTFSLGRSFSYFTSQCISVQVIFKSVHFGTSHMQVSTQPLKSESLFSLVYYMFIQGLSC